MENLEIFFTGSAVILSALLLVNFIHLILKYSKERYLPIVTTSGSDLIDKHGPVICSCILQKRDVMPRDIIGILTGLVQRDVIHITSKRISEDGDIINEYTLKLVDKDAKLSEDEKDLINILFENRDECILNNEVKTLKEKSANMVKRIREKLEQLGVNAIKVPKSTQIKNTIFFIMVCIFLLLHLVVNFDEDGFFKNLTSNVINWIIVVIKIDALFILFSLLVKMITLLYERIKSKINKSKIEITDGLTINIFTKVLLSNIIMLLLLVFAGNDMAFIADIVLFDISILVMVADELFVTHSPRINKDYISLKEFEVSLKNKAIIEYFTPEQEPLLKKYIPLLVCLDMQDADPCIFLKKIVDITALNEEENRKYVNILSLMEFNEPKIASFYFSKKI